MSSEYLPQRSTPSLSGWQAAPTASSFSARAAAAQDEGVPWWRYIAALRRFKWLVMAVSALGIGGGVVATRLIDPEYEVRATIWVAGSKDDGANSRGPIRAQQLLSSTAWVELLRSYAITEPVARRLNLFLTLETPADSVVFRGLAVSDALRPGHYQLQLRGGQYILQTPKGARIEQGAAGDSIGRRIGLLWAPPASVLPSDRTIEFGLKTPREAAMDMASHASAILPEESNFLRITLTGKDPRVAAATLNVWIEQFVQEAGRLKRQNLTELAGVLRDQLAISEQQLKSAESDLEGFRVKTITLPTEGAPIASGIEQTRDPVFNNFFEKRLAAETARHDREALERVLADARNGASVADGLLSLPGIVQSSDELRTALNDLYQKRAQLRTLRETYTDEYGPVRTAREDVDRLEKTTIPQMAARVETQLLRRESDLDSTIAGASRELRNIPARTIEEMRLRRDVVVAENLYTTLQGRYEEAKLAEASAVPDISVLDPAVAPLRPSANTAPRMLLMASFGAVGFALALALVLDRFDSRFRYPKQATHELGLEIIGFLPTLRSNRRGETDMLTASQLMEACRQIRMHIQHALPAGPSVVTITSPGPGEGKSLTATNVALAFAAEGKRTLLIDGDVRRGALHQVFGGPAAPGLTECLASTATAEQAIRQTEGNEHLWFLPRGTRSTRAPELLASSNLPMLVSQLGMQFDAIVIDSAPMGAGIDAFALSVAAGNMLIVLRAGTTDRRMAEEKLRLAERLPIALLGCVVNDVLPQGEYEYYSYLPGYEAVSEPAAIEG